MQDPLETALSLLDQGQIVAMPTETVYGLAARIDHPAALAEVFAVKERPLFDPLIVHVYLNQTSQWLQELSQQKILDAKQLQPAHIKALTVLIQKYWPGPLTLVLPKAVEVHDLITAGLPTVGLRMPKHPMAQALIKKAGPLAAPSANRFGKISPTEASHVRAELGDRIPLILDGGPCTVGIESTVLGFDQEDRSGKSLILYRPGMITIEELQASLNNVENGYVIRHYAGSALGSRAEASPGTQASHYAPETELYLVHEELNQCRILPCTSGRALHPRSKVGMITVKDQPLSYWKERFPLLTYRSLSKNGDLKEIACNLFAVLRDMDAKDCDVIFSEVCHESSGIGYAINNRLQRAAQQEGKR